MAEEDPEALKPPTEEQATEERVVQDEGSALPANEAGCTDDVAAEQPTEENLPAKPKPKLCGICEKEGGRYKCPRCSLP